MLKCVISKWQMDANSVTVGKVVLIRFKGAKTGIFKVCIKKEGFKQNLDTYYISPKAPLAQAILTHKTGEEVEFDTPDQKLRVEIINIL